MAAAREPAERYTEVRRGDASEVPKSVGCDGVATGMRGGLVARRVYATQVLETRPIATPRSVRSLVCRCRRSPSSSSVLTGAPTYDDDQTTAQLLQEYSPPFPSRLTMRPAAFKVIALKRREC